MDNTRLALSNITPNSNISKLDYFRAIIQDIDKNFTLLNEITDSKLASKDFFKENLMMLNKNYELKFDQCYGFDHYEKNDKEFGKIILRKKNTSKIIVTEIDKKQANIYANRMIINSKIMAAMEIMDLQLDLNIHKETLLEVANRDLFALFNKYHDMLEYSHLENLNDQSLEKFTKNNDINIKNFNADLIEVLKNNKVKDAGKKLFDTLPYITLQGEKATIISMNELEFIRLNSNITSPNYNQHIHDKFTKLIIASPLQSLSESQLKEYTNHTKEDWYINMLPFKKKLFDKYKDLISDEMHIIPNKLDYIPGLRNGFIRNDFVLNQQNKVIAQAESIHMANPAAINTTNQNSSNITKKNLLNLTDQIGNINISCLIAPNDFQSKGEGQIYKDMNKAIVEINSNAFKKNHILFNAISINLLKDTPQSMHLKDIKKFIIEMIEEVSKSQNIKNNLESVKIFQNLKQHANDLFNKKKPKIIPNSITKLSGIEETTLTLMHKIYDMRSKNFLQKFIELISNLIRILLKKDVKNDQMQLHLYINELVVAVNEFLLDDEKYSNVLHCKSGKDRTAIMTELTQAAILAPKIMDELNKNAKEKDVHLYEIEKIKEKLLDNSLASNHSIYLNGSEYGGNAVGTFGVVKGSAFTVDPQYKPIFNKHDFFTYSAAQNKFVIGKKSTNSLVISEVSASSHFDKPTSSLPQG